MSCLRHLEKPIKTKENKVKHFVLLFLYVFIGFVLFFIRRQQVNNEVKVNSFCLALLVVNSLQYYLQSLHLRSTGGLSLKWESHRNHEGITWDLRPSWSTCIGEILGDGSLPMQGDLEGQFLILDATCFAPRTRKITNVG